MTQQQANISPSVMEDASQWYARLSSGDASDHDVVQHMDWLLAAPEHAEAYEMVAQAMRKAGDVETAARARFGDELKSAKPSLWAWLEGIFETWRLPQIAGGVAAAAMLMFFVTTSFNSDPSLTSSREYSANAKVEVFTLADGSRLSLFGGTSAYVQMEENRRVVELASGRAFFDVTSDADRPFVVRTGDHEVRVVGTRFEVIKSDELERVAVNEGLVAVKAGPSTEPLMISPGMVAAFDDAGGDPVVTQVATILIGAWAEGVLVFRDASVAEVIAKLGVVFPDQSIRVANEALAQQRFSGTLVVTDANQMMQQLAAFLELGLQTSGNEIVLVGQ